VLDLVEQVVANVLDVLKRLVRDGFRRDGEQPVVTLAISTRTYSGSPSSPNVEGTKPKSNGNTAPAGTPVRTNAPRCGSYVYLFYEPSRSR
jgi:hypothetical protein